MSPITLFKNYRHEMSRQALLARHTAVVVASEHMRAEYLRQGVPSDRLHIAALPSPRLQADPQPPAARRPGGRLLFIGRLLPAKGAHYLVRALPAAGGRLGRELTLTVAGAGPQERRLRELAERQRVHVHFAGWLGVEERVQQMRDADLLAVPSLWPEPFGLVGIEAGCVGLPAVAFSAGGIPDWLSQGESGELAPSNPPTVEGLADAIVRALRDPDHYNDLRLGAWRRAQRYTLASHLDRLMPILETASRERDTVHAAI